MKFKEYINEGYKNLFQSDESQKMMYADEVYDLLTKSYKKIGGLKGKGFRSPTEMVKMVPFWKLAFVKEELVAVIMYKDKGTGRKLVAVGAKPTPEGKKRLLEIFKMEFSRSFAEVSGPLLKWLIKTYPDVVNKYKIPASEVRELFPGIHVKETEKYFYSRMIGGDTHEKMLLGTIGKSIR